MGELRSGGDLKPVIVLCALAAAGYSAYALLRHFHYWSGLDLGIFNQAVWHYSNFESPASTVKGGLDLRADHFHPILMLLAPLYWIADEPALLLVAQAVLVAASIVPVFLFARERLERFAAYAVAVAYAIFWGVWAGVGFEFHEVAFAPLVVALGILWGDRRQWRRFAAAMVLLALVKEDMALVVAFFGVWLLSRRDWAPGAATAVGGLAAFFLVTQVAMPHFGDGVGFQYWTYDRLGADLPDAAGRVAARPWLPFEVALDDAQKVKTMGGMLAPFLALSLCSRIGLIAVPLVAERMLSSNESLWVAPTHYTLPLAPVLAMAAAAGLANLAGLLPREARRRAVALAAAAMLILGAAFNQLAAKTPARIKAYLPQRSLAAPAARALERVPDGASVASPVVLYPRLTARATADLIRPDMARVDYIVVGLLESTREVGDVLRAQLSDFEPVFHERGWVVLRRRAAGRDDRLAPLPERRLKRAAFEWTAAAGAYVAALSDCRPGEQRCFREAGSGFREEQAALRGLLRRAGANGSGGCGELPALAERAAVETAGLLGAARAAGLAGGPDEARAALEELRRAVDRRDLPGRVLIVAELCAPSKATLRP